MSIEMSLDEFAAVSAAAAEGDLPLDAVLATRSWTVAAWREISDAWSRGIAADEALAEAYAEAFVRAQDALRPVPAMTPEEWAVLVLDMAAEGPTALEKRGLRAADHLRLIRHWAKVLGADRGLAARYAKRFYEGRAR